MSGLSRFLFLPALIVTVLAGFLFWRWLGEPVALPEVPGGRLQCLSYTAFEPGELGATAPGWVSSARIADDLRRLRSYTDCLRLYSPLGNTPRVVEAAARQGFRILLGAWIGGDLEQNEKEIRGALELAHRYPQTISAIVVGNEVLLRREMSGEKLAALISDVREQSPVPVAYADVAHFIQESPPVADAADLLLIHLLPYWDDPEPPPVDEAVDQVIRTYAEFREHFPGKDVMIGETGWPSRGRMRGPGKPGLVNEALFVRSFAAQAEQLGIRYNLIEAIDQPWKRPPEGTVGGYWGILDEHREAKFPLQGPVSGWPQWRTRFAAMAVMIFAVLAAALRSRPGAGAWIGWSALSLALALALVFQWDYAMATSQSAWGWLAGGLAAACSIASAALLGSMIGGSSPEPPARLVDLGRVLPAAGRVVRTAALRLAAFAAMIMIPAAWTGLTLAFAPRHRDIPIAQFALPAIALAVLRFRSRRAGIGDQREESVLAAVLIVCGLLQLDIDNEESIAWLGISALLAWPWLGFSGGGLLRFLRRPAHARQADQRGQNS